MKTKEIIGWDIGGAHVKAVVADQEQIIIRVIQQACPLWQGLGALPQAVTEIIAEISLTESMHALTMTGELVDLFDSRLQGVQEIVKIMRQLLGEDQLLIYAGGFGFLAPNQITEQHLNQIASTNWLASVSYVTKQLDGGLFVDIGSTTSDIIIFNQGRVLAQGLTDYQRLATRELVYTGIVRTPVMALARAIEFQGQSVGLMAEYFATMADVYRITGELNEHYDQMPAADNGAKTTEASLRRLARMVGCDAQDFSLSEWQQLAEQLKAEQLQQLQQACLRQLDRNLLSKQAILVGAGVGKFLAKQLAHKLGLPYQEMSGLISNNCTADADMDVADCAPAVAVACLVSGKF